MTKFFAVSWALGGRDAPHTPHRYIPAEKHWPKLDNKCSKLRHGALLLLIENFIYLILYECYPLRAFVKL